MFVLDVLDVLQALELNSWIRYEVMLPCCRIADGGLHVTVNDVAVVLYTIAALSGGPEGTASTFQCSQ